MSPLLPCPFCGYKVHTKDLSHTGRPDILFIVCDRCGSCTSFAPKLKQPIEFTHEEARAAWNRRAETKVAVACVPWHREHGFEWRELEHDPAEVAAKGDPGGGWQLVSLYATTDPLAAAGVPKA